MNRENILHNAAAASRLERFDDAMTFLQPLASAGDSQAQFQMGSLHFLGAEMSKKSAFEWLKKAADQEHPEAMYHIAHTDLSPQWFPELVVDVRRQLLLKAAELGSVSACHALGVSFATGDWEGVNDGPKDQTEAYRWYARAASLGDAEAKYNLATMVLMGEGCAQNSVEGLSLLQQAALDGNEDARHLVEDIYRHGHWGITTDEKVANLWRDVVETFRELRTKNE